MARDLILHIGTSKTGSTSIQRVLSRQRREMLAQGIAYPRSPGFERHGYLAMAATTDRKRVDNTGKPVWKGSSPEARLAQFRTEFATEMSELPASVHRVIISAEQFSMTLLDHQSVQNLHDLVAPHVDRIQVVVWLRRPDQHFASLYSQMLRYGDAQPPGLRHAKVTPAHGYDFDGLLDRWAAVFGEASIKPQLFERVPGKKFDVVDDFLALCGLKLDPDAIKAAAAVNQALSQAAQAALYEAAERIRDGGRGNVSSLMWQKLVDAATVAAPGRSWQPTRAEAAAFCARWADNHEAVRRRWFPQRTSLFSQDFSSLPEVAPVIDQHALATASLRIVLTLGEKVVALQDKIAPGARPGKDLPSQDERLQRLVARRVLIEPADVDPRLDVPPVINDTALVDASVGMMLTLGRKVVTLEDKLAQKQLPAVEQAGAGEKLHRLLSRRVMVEPNDLDARLKLAQALQKSGDLPAARRQVDTILSIDPDHEAALALDAELPPAPPQPTHPDRHRDRKAQRAAG